MNGRPTRIEMSEEGKNKISFQNYQKQMKVPYLIYADFKALVWKMPGCERGPESKSHTEKTELHEACGYAYKVVRSDGEVVGSGVYRGQNAVGNFLEDRLWEEQEIRKLLSRTVPIKMKRKDCEKCKTAKHCHICGKDLV